MASWFKNRQGLSNFRDHIRPHLVGKRCRYLEIGSWGGDSLVWTLENILNHPKSSAVVVDPYLPVVKHNKKTVQQIYERMRSRIQPWAHRCTIYRQPSSVWLRHHDYPPQTFNFIYIDGDHTDLLVMDDAVLSWPLLKIGGFMVFDDYGSRRRDQHHVRHAVAGFMAVYGRDYCEEIFCNYQYGIKKTNDVTMLAFNQRGRKRNAGITIQPEVWK